LCLSKSVMVCSPVKCGLHSNAQAGIRLQAASNMGLIFYLPLR
jgi:hypothetical protein